MTDLEDRRYFVIYFFLLSMELSTVSIITEQFAAILVRNNITARLAKLSLTG